MPDEYGLEIDFVTFSADGEYLATAHRNKDAVELWDAHSGSLMRTFYGHNNYVTAISFLQEDKLLASGDMDGIIKIWDVENGNLVREMAGSDRYPVTSLKYAPSRELLVCSDAGNTVTGWHIDDWDSMHLRIGKGRTVIYSMEVLPDEQNIVLGCGDRTLRFVNLDDWRVVRTIKAKSIETRLAVFPDGKHMLVAGGYKSEIRVLDLDTGRDTLFWRSPMYEIASVACSPDGKTIACSTDDTLLMMAAPRF